VAKLGFKALNPSFSRLAFCRQPDDLMPQLAHPVTCFADLAVIWTGPREFSQDLRPYPQDVVALE
jgi:hypothetical protein